MKENECKEKKIYGWCASKEKNIDVAWRVVGKLEHEDVHHYIRPQHSVNDIRHDSSPLRR